MDPFPPVYPVSLVVADRACLVVGGGSVAARKVEGLVRCGARVTVVAPVLSDPIQALGEAVTVRRRPYRSGDVSGFRLVVTATGVPSVDAAVARDAELAGIWVNSADDPANCSVLLPSIHRDDPVTVAVSTAGTSPALAIWVRQQVAAVLGPGLGATARLLDEARRRLQDRGRATESVDWQVVLEGPLRGLVAAGRTEEARALLAAFTDEPS